MYVEINVVLYTLGTILSFVDWKRKMISSLFYKTDKNKYVRSNDMGKELDYLTKLYLVKAFNVRKIVLEN